MYTIAKISSESAIDYAAEELKKYLRMMMPECGDIKISYRPEAVSGFRLGLMQDFGLDVSDVQDPELDDLLYVDCTEEGGIIAGDNPRSVLLAVYEYLRRNGCRWLMPGIDGEMIPMQEITAVSFRHKPSMRYRGWCNEGAESQQCMLDAIEFIPKVGMNVFMMEFRIPVPYYNSYYNHSYNAENRSPEPVSWDTVLQWKRQCESEIAKRGLQFHDIGHGWTADPFGVDSSLRESMGDNEKHVSEEARQYLAMMNGERKLFRNRPNFTNFCMSNPVAQKKFVTYIAQYARMHSNSDYLHVWLADLSNNHCECDACREKTPSDWYVILLNMLDEELTAQGLNTRIVFIVYVDTSWAPVTEKIRNQERFTLMLAPISRNYTYSLPEGKEMPQTVPYVRNQLTLPGGLDEYFAYLADWRKMWHGANVAYEYHFWRHQCFDLAGIEFAKRINEDIKVYEAYQVSGLIEDGSQRSFFPTGLPFYTYARTLFDTSLTPEEIAAEYYETAFGEGAPLFLAYMKKVGDAFDFYYLEGMRSADPEVSPYYNPERSKVLSEFEQIAEEGSTLIETYYNRPTRLGTVSVRLLEQHLEFAKGLAKALAAKALGEDEEARNLFEELRISFGKKEIYLERYYDQFNYCYAYRSIFQSQSKRKENVIAAEE